MENKNHKLQIARALVAGILFLTLVLVLVPVVAASAPAYLNATTGLLLLVACCGSMPYLY